MAAFRFEPSIFWQLGEQGISPVLVNNQVKNYVMSARGPTASPATAWGRSIFRGSCTRRARDAAIITNGSDMPTSRPLSTRVRLHDGLTEIQTPRSSTTMR
jgi:hypothetical protein